MGNRRLSIHRIPCLNKEFCCVNCYVEEAGKYLHFRVPSGFKSDSLPLDSSQNFLCDYGEFSHVVCDAVQSSKYLYFRLAPGFKLDLLQVQIPLCTKANILLYEAQTLIKSCCSIVVCSDNTAVSTT
jgi:hypothetical protein